MKGFGFDEDLTSLLLLLDIGKMGEFTLFNATGRATGVDKIGSAARFEGGRTVIRVGVASISSNALVPTRSSTSFDTSRGCNFLPLIRVGAPEGPIATVGVRKSVERTGGDSRGIIGSELTTGASERRASFPQFSPSSRKSNSIMSPHSETSSK